MPGRVAFAHAAAMGPQVACMASFIGAGYRWLGDAKDPVRPDEGSA